MNKFKIHKILQKLGLDKDCSILYLHLINKGPQTPLEISKLTNINRTKIYRMAKILKEKGLLEETGDNWSRILKTSSLKCLEMQVKQKEEELQEIKNNLPELIKNLSTVINTPLPIFNLKIYKKISGLRQLYWNTLEAKKEILVFNYQTRNEAIGRKFAEITRLEQIKRKIHLYEIENLPLSADFDDYTSLENWKIYYHTKNIPKEILKIRQQILIYSNTIAIVNWLKDERVGIEIINDNLAEMFRQTFWHFWKISEQVKKH